MITRVVTPAALSSDPAVPLPERLKVLAWGDNPNANGRRVNVGTRFLQALTGATYPYLKIPLDFEHNTVPGTLAYAETKEPRDVAGYATVEVIPGQGVFLSMSRWTQIGRTSASSFEDLSACPYTDDDGNVVALPSVALCRTGAVPGIEFVQSPLTVWPGLSAVMPGDPAQTPSEESKKMEYKKILTGMLKLPDTATDEEIQAAIIKANKPVDASATPAPLSAEKLTEAIDARLLPLMAQFDKQHKEAVLLGARIEGKVVALSAEAIGKLSVADLTEHVKALAVTVPLTALTPAHVEESQTAIPLTADQLAIARNCGLTAEEVYGKEKAAVK